MTGPKHVVGHDVYKQISKCLCKFVDTITIWHIFD